MKREVLLIFNSENTKKRERKSKRIFRELFPNVYNIFTEIKKENYKVFPILLICLESHIFLDIVCNRISIEHSNLVNYPVHDCIITTKSNEQIVDEIIKGEIEKVFGIKPNLKHEDLNKENAFKELEELRSKVKSKTILNLV